MEAEVERFEGAAIHRLCESADYPLSRVKVHGVGLTGGTDFSP
jgi:hypothetical protein